MESVELLDALAYLMCLLGCKAFLWIRWYGSPYGRYSSQYSGPCVPVRAAWVLQELPSLAWPLLECACASAVRLDRLPNRVLLAMFLVHYIYRTLIFPFVIRGGKPTPLFTCVTAFLFCLYNGYLQSRYLSHYAVYAEDWVTQPCFLAGGLFEYVTAANYLGESVEWFGFALASWSLQGAAFALFTFCVLLSRAMHHHRWYLEKFEDYPKSRKILIPFLY
ncbi:3-oxo-5-alpha-steroid 4-dehydrogenase 1 isoform X2 [Octodon degus]|uniref:3-oxo-5-alpha-steroid 4-dehydrogenase 1 isoform X2 n=1 Tax=Octodon degus TaxID=10160 RepID=A0A6P6DKT9_OCTDE|nr:3-oxo-5-alpha-steroid 4-dehydrogenase 1 isoform X2 [Octodon degus]